MSDYNSDVVSFQGSFFLNTANFGGSCSSNQESNPKDLIDYKKQVVNKPSINGVELEGNKTTDDLHIEIPIKSISQNGVEKEIIDGKININAPEREMNYSEMLDIWKQWFG